MRKSHIFQVSDHCLVSSQLCKDLHNTETTLIPPLFAKCRCTTISLDEFRYQLLGEKVSEANHAYHQSLLDSSLEEFKEEYVDMLFEAIEFQNRYFKVFWIDPDLEIFLTDIRAMDLNSEGS